MYHFTPIAVSGSTETDVVYTQGRSETGHAQVVLSGAGAPSGSSELLILGAADPEGPFAPLLDTPLDLTTASTNTLLLNVTLMPVMRAKVRNGATTGGSVTVDVYLET